MKRRGDVKANKGNVCIITMGCPKNEIDSEYAVSSLLDAGWDIAADPDDADIIVVNTCGFMQDACSESIDTLLELANRKPEANIVATGCMTARYGREVFQAMEEVAMVVDGEAHGNLPAFLEKLVDSSKRLRFGKDAAARGNRNNRGRLQAGGISEYVKIAEGCDRKCSFCTIPSIRGRMKSRNAKDIVIEVKNLLDRGVRELTFIAQDTTAFGRDRGDEDGLAGLVDLLGGDEKDHWLRFLYLHPAGITGRLIEALAGNSRVCRYLDIPLQHTSGRILSLMRRGHGRRSVRKIIEGLRTDLSGWALRTTFITGFPGESEEEFDQLLEFVEEMRFERVGGFVFSPEPGTSAAALPGTVPEELAQERLDRLMKLQGKISLENNQLLIGKTITVLVDREEGRELVCRSEWDAPEIDQNVRIRGADALPGEFLRVRIDDATEYDLYGVCVLPNE